MTAGYENSKFLKKPLTVGVVLAPFSGGQKKKGVELAPQKVVTAGLVPDLEGLGWKVNCDSDKASKVESERFPPPENDEPIGHIVNPRYVAKVTEEISKEVTDVARQGALPLTIGGDHSLAIGTLTGTYAVHPDMCVIWVDAHADFNTCETSPSGNLHGLPNSFVFGLKGNEKVPHFNWIKQHIPTSRIAFIGLRDIDPEEKQILRDNNIATFTMHHVDKYGIGAVVEKALDAVNANRTRPVHLSFDVDALDPSVAPSTGTAVRGGLTFREGHYICEALAETGLLIGVDIMEINPALGTEDNAKATIEVGRSLSRAALGETLF